MELDFAKISVREVLGVYAHPMRPGHYELKGKKRYSDCFIYVCSGSAFYTFQDKTFTASKGDVFYLAYKSRYDIDVAEDYYVTYIDCMLDAPKDCCFESDIWHIGEGEDVESLLMRLNRKYIPTDTGSRLLALSTLYTLFGTLHKIRTQGYLSSDNRAKMQAAKETIEQNVGSKDFVCTSLSRDAGLSGVHFRRLFMRYFGMTPYQFLTTLRMCRAKTMLLASQEASVAEIAEATGYQSVYYFSRAFKRETGMTPTQYRKGITP